MTPLARVLRTLVQIGVAVTAVVPLVVALAVEVGIDLDGPRLVAIVAAAVALATGLQAALEQAGLIPVLAAGVGWPAAQPGEPVAGAPLYTRDEVAAALAEIEDPTAVLAVLDQLTDDGVG